MTTRLLLLVSAMLLALAGCKSHDGWINQIGGANVDAVFGLTVTGDDRVCLTGTFISVAGFGTTASPLELDSGGYSDIFVACYASDGAPAFATRFGVTQKNDQPRAIAAAPGGDVLVTGFFSNTFGTPPGPVLQAPGPANSDIFLARADIEGNTVWARHYGGTQSDSGRAVTVDRDGNIVLAGAFQGQFPYTEDGVGYKMSSAGSRDAFVAKLRPNGDMLWARRFGGSGSDEAYAVTTTSDGAIVVAGTFSGETSGDSGPRLESSGYNDIFVRSYTGDGELRWSRAFGGTGQEHIGGLANGSGGRVWLAGSFQNEISFANGQSLASNGSTDGLLVRLDAQGTVERALSFGGEEVELVYAIAAAADGSLLLAGHFQTAADLAPGPGETVYQASGTADTDGFVLKLDANGVHRGATVFGGDDTAISNGVGVLGDGAVAAAGIFGKQLFIDGHSKPALVSRGKSDVFVVRMND